MKIEISSFDDMRCFENVNQVIFHDSDGETIYDDIECIQHSNHYTSITIVYGQGTSSFTDQYIITKASQ
ncbi:Uncharacterised protein [Chlamydia trachomatis]|nr:Uncharacterised protein [Chlamydia trachomatis]